LKIKLVFLEIEGRSVGEALDLITSSSSFFTETIKMATGEHPLVVALDSSEEEAMMKMLWILGSVPEDAQILSEKIDESWFAHGRELDNKGLCSYEKYLDYVVTLEEYHRILSDSIIGSVKSLADVRSAAQAKPVVSGSSRKSRKSKCEPATRRSDRFKNLCTPPPDYCDKNEPVKIVTEKSLLSRKNSSSGSVPSSTHKKEKHLSTADMPKIDFSDCPCSADKSCESCSSVVASPAIKYPSAEHSSGVPCDNEDHAGPALDPEGNEWRLPVRHACGKLYVPGYMNHHGEAGVAPASLMTLETNPVVYVDILGWTFDPENDFVEPILKYKHCRWCELYLFHCKQAFSGGLCRRCKRQAPKSAREHPSDLA
jgi:hypothetical protein